MIVNTYYPEVTLLSTNQSHTGIPKPLSSYHILPSSYRLQIEPQGCLYNLLKVMQLNHRDELENKPNFKPHSIPVSK